MEDAELHRHQERFGTLYEECYLQGGVRQGRCVSYYPPLPDSDSALQGPLASESFYRDGKLHGAVRYWSPKGQLLAHSHYECGLKEGTSRFWYLSGQLYSEQSYFRGLRQGSQFYYYESGQLRTRMEFEQGHPIGVTEQFYPSGQLRRTISYLQGVRHGKDSTFAPDGLPLIEAHYERGVPCGTLSLYHEGGQLAERYEYLGPAWRFHVERYDRQGCLWQRGRSLDTNHYEETTYGPDAEVVRRERVVRSNEGCVLHIESFEGPAACPT